MSETGDQSVTGRLRKASLSTTNALLNFNPQPGMWAATGTAIAYAPTLTELREPVIGGENIEFNNHGHSARIVVKDDSGAPVLSLAHTRTPVLDGGATEEATKEKDGEVIQAPPQRRPTLA